MDPLFLGFNADLDRRAQRPVEQEIEIRRSTCTSRPKTHKVATIAPTCAEAPAWDEVTRRW